MAYMKVGENKRWFSGSSNWLSPNGYKYVTVQHFKPGITRRKLCHISKGFLASWGKNKVLYPLHFYTVLFGYSNVLPAISLIQRTLATVGFFFFHPIGIWIGFKAVDLNVSSFSHLFGELRQGFNEINCSSCCFKVKIKQYHESNTDPTFKYTLVIAKTDNHLNTPPFPHSTLQTL